MGQELTARTKYRGTVKKKIFGLKIKGKVIDRNVYYKNKNILYQIDAMESIETVYNNILQIIE